jgi:hypothetical protein
MIDEGLRDADTVRRLNTTHKWAALTAMTMGHRGRLSRADAADTLDFTAALFERLYPEREKLRVADLRRVARRTAVP